jgi:hypothetical protein
MYIKNIFLLAFILLWQMPFAQVTNQGKPLSWKVEDQIDVQPFQLPDFDLKARLQQDSIRDLDRSKPYRFGKEFSVDIDINEDGQWINLSNGSRVWVMNIRSNNAKTMNFIFDEFHLPEGSQLYFYNDQKIDLLGAYTSSQNQDNGVFGSWLVDGDNVWIAYQEPANTTEEVELHLSKAVHGYRSISDFETSKKGLNDSGDCNLDVDCPIGSDFDDKKDELKKSVGLMIAGGSGFCTGTLINNTNNDGTQYFLTANHCLGGNPSNLAFRFNWTSPNPQCATFTSSQNGTFDQTVSGSTLVASNAKSDFGLLEINPNLNSSWDLVWAGWDRSASSPNFSVGIHHPSGDIMKVCRNDDFMQQTTEEFSGEANMEIWMVDNWEQGVTEPGSSGSALFDENGRIIGQLAGGAAACNGTSNNGQLDFYGRFDVSWDFGNTASSRLSDWLDPGNTGAMTVDQFPPEQVFANDATVSISNLPDETCDGQVDPSINIMNNGTNDLTSATIEYQFNSQSLTTINWTGSLAQGESEVVATPNFTATSTNNTLSVDLSQPNGIADENDNNNSVSSQFTKFEVFTTNQNELNLTINTDNWGNETTWEVTDESDTVIASGGPYANVSTNNETISVSNDQCYTFTIFDSQGDGICCGFGIGDYTLETDDQVEIISGGDFGGSESVSFRIENNLSINELEAADLVIYPNPVRSSLTIEAETSSIYSYTIYSINGKRILNGKFEGENTNISTNKLSYGVYLLQLSDENKNKITKRIIKE